MSLVVFSSYSHRDFIVRERVASAVQNLRPDGVITFIHDAFDLHMGDDVEEWIENSLADADVLMTILTPQSITSWWVLLELMLARRYGCRIIAICAFPDNQSRLPKTLPEWLDRQFLVKILPEELMSADHVQRIAIQIATELDRCHRDSMPVRRALGAARVALAKLSKQLGSNAHFEHEFRAKQAGEVLQEAEREIVELRGKTYAQNLSLSKAFVLRAQPIFSEAAAIYATSVDFVSTFWEREARGLAPGYLAAHKSDVKRLFVFSSPRQANRHLEVLEAHHRQYGQNGRVGGCVLLTTSDYYHDFVQTQIGSDAQELMDGDFAILRYGVGGAAGEVFYEARLTKDWLRCEQSEGGLSHSRKNFVAEMIRIVEQTKEGEFDPANTGILRWSSRFVGQDANARETWRNALETLFHRQKGVGESTRDRDVFHLVFFRRDAAHATKDAAYTLRQAISEVVDRLLSLRNKRNNGRLIKELWFGDWNAGLRRLQVRDGRFHGVINTAGLFIDSFPFCLLMRFENRDDLEFYYEHPIHSDCREKLFMACDPEIAKLYALAREATADSKPQLYRAIEAAASQFVLRADYVEHEDLDWIVSHESRIPFGMSEKR